MLNFLFGFGIGVFLGIFCMFMLISIIKYYKFKEENEDDIGYDDFIP